MNFMYKVVLADDEKIIVEGLKAFIDWEEAGFSIAGEAYNGEDGVRLAQETGADVVITDIRMPLLSGTEMISRIREFNPDCKFMVLSGYSSFEYAQDAVNRGAFCYLLKPVQEEQLRNNLEAIRKELDAKNLQTEEMTKLHTQLQESLPVVRERYLCEMATDDTMKPEQILKKWEFLNLGYSLDCFGIFVMEVDGLEKKYGEDIENMMLLRFAVINITEELVYNKRAGVVFSYARDRIAVLCCGMNGAKPDHQSILELARDIQGTIKRCLKETVSIGIGKLYTMSAGMCRSFEEAERALKYKLIYGENSLVDVYEIEEEDRGFTFPLELEKNLLSMVELGKTEEAGEILRDIFDYAMAGGASSPQTVYDLCMNFAVLVSRCAVLSGIPYGGLGGGSGFMERLLEMKTAGELQEYLEQIVTQTTEKIQKNRMQKQQGTLGKVKEYVEQHYAEDLTLDFLAKKFFMNACYLSQLFKKELGCNFVDFLTGIRITAAKKLILDPELKVYEVGCRTGYNNPRYFSQLFERLTGYTPSEYRKKMIE